MQNFTPEDLLLYQSGELDATINRLISEELSVNWVLREKFTVLKEALSKINSMKLNAPRNQTVQNIMRYAMRKKLTV